MFDVCTVCPETGTLLYQLWNYADYAMEKVSSNGIARDKDIERDGDIASNRKWA